jgi:hypothetical protein
MQVQQQDHDGEVQKRGKNLKCTSCVLAILGVLGLGASMVHSFGARHIAEKMYRAHKTDFDPQAGVSREEFDLYDNIKNSGFIQFLISILVVCMAMKGFKLVRAQKAHMAHHMFKKMKFSVLLIVIFGLVLGSLEHEKKRIIHRIVGETRQNNQTQYGQEDMPHRSLASDDCSAVKAQDACDATSGCTWCRSAAVRSQCVGLEDAKSLPPSIFACDGLSLFGKRDEYPRGGEHHKRGEHHMRGHNERRPHE